MFGANWTSAVKIMPTQNVTNPYVWPFVECDYDVRRCPLVQTSYDLVSTAYPDYLQFKIKTTFTNNQVHYSPIATISIAAVYTVTSQN